MIGLLLVLVVIFLLIPLVQSSFVHFKFFQLKEKIKSDPLIGKKEEDNNYCYKEGSYSAVYKIKEIPPGTKSVEWLFLRRRLTFLEEKFLNIKRFINSVFIYQRWVILFRPWVIIVLIASLSIFYLGITGYSQKKIQRFKWVAAQITGISPESIEYKGLGWFKVSGQRRPLDKTTEPVVVSFNPFNWFFSDSAIIKRWSEKSNKYITYPVTINDQGDVWLDKRGDKVHGKALGDKVIWDEPQGQRKVPSHNIIIENGKLKILDE